MKNDSGDKHFDNILNYLQDNTGKVKISAYEKKLLERWQFGYTCLMQHDTYENVLPMLKKIFGLSRTSAYISLDYSVKLFGRSKSIVNFGDTNLYNKIIESYNRAKAAGNHQAEAMVLSVFNRFMARQKATSDLEQPVNNITLQITANPEDVGLQSYSEEQIAELEKMVVERKKLRD